MTRRLVLVLLIGLALSCAREQVVPAGNGPGTQDWYDEGPNLLSLLRGVTIVDRSGEASFESAALFTMDGHPGSVWSTPPGDLQQWFIAELPVRSRVDALGLSSGVLGDSPSIVKELRFELSSDGMEWHEAGTFSFEIERQNQINDITPTEARYVRVTTVKNYGGETVTYVPTILVRGEELDAYQRPSVSGHWMLNDLSAHFREDGRRVYGHVDMDPPMLIDGAWGDRIIRFTWARGRTYGVGMMSVNPAGDTLDGIWWYENFVEAGNEMGSPWYGTRIGDPDEFQIDTSGIAQIHVERDGRYPMFGLIFDDEGNFDRDASRPAVDFIQFAIESFPQFRVRLEVSEFHSPDQNQNMARSRQVAGSLVEGLVEMGVPREKLVVTAVGSERPYPARNAPLHWAMYSRVDFALTAAE